MPRLSPRSVSGQCKRRQYFVNSKIQLPIAKHGLVLVLAAGVFAAGFFHIVSNILELYQNEVVLFSLGEFGKNSFLIIYALCFIVVVFWMLFIVSVYFSHRVAGPVEKISRQLNAIADGAVVQPLSLRDGDHLTNLSKAVNNLHSKLDKRTTEVAELAEKIALQLNALDDRTGTELALQLRELVPAGKGQCLSGHRESWIGRQTD